MNKSPAVTPALAEDINTIARFLARRDEPLEGAACMVLLGSALPCQARYAARLFQQGLSGRVLISGGLGHSTNLLWQAVVDDPACRSISAGGRPEADIFADIFLNETQGKPADLLLENASTNCMDNAVQSRNTFEALGPLPESLLLIQDPTMAFRTHLCFEVVFGPRVCIRSQAPFAPRVRCMDGRLSYAPDMPAPIWAMDRFVSLVTGEITRLCDTPQGYGPRGRGFLPHVDLPEAVLHAHERLKERLPSEYLART